MHHAIQPFFYGLPFSFHLLFTRKNYYNVKAFMDHSIVKRKAKEFK